jgi:hypothetical protein
MGGKMGCKQQGAGHQNTTKGERHGTGPLFRPVKGWVVAGGWLEEASTVWKQ